jgi:L-threonylcarbamoyladenylate synthase
MKDNNDYDELRKPAKAIKEGKLVLMPTETVYGLGANALDSNAVKNIFVAKGRESDNPLIVHISDITMLNSLIQGIGEVEQKLIDEFWPGPLTIIFKKKEVVPSIVTAGLDTVGIRMPSNIIARKLIEYSGVPIAAPSANISGKPSGTNIDDIAQEFDGKVEYIIDGGNVDIGIESTVVKVVDGIVNILRPGKITPEEIIKLIGNAVIDKHVLIQLEEGEKPESPGMKYRHYAPNTKCIMVYSSDPKKLVDKINELSINKNVLILGRTKNLEKYISDTKLDMGNTLEDVARNIFTLLRKVDGYNVDLVIIEGTEKEGLGLAINNRLIRACGYNYMEI